MTQYYDKYTTISFRSMHGRDWKIELWYAKNSLPAYRLDNYHGYSSEDSAALAAIPETLCGADSPIEWEEDNTGDMTTCVRKSTGTLHLWVEDDAQAKWMRQVVRFSGHFDRKLVVYRKYQENGEDKWKLMWHGYIKPESLSQDWNSTPYKQDFPICDNLYIGGQIGLDTTPMESWSYSSSSYTVASLLNIIMQRLEMTYIKRVCCTVKEADFLKKEIGSQCQFMDFSVKDGVRTITSDDINEIITKLLTPDACCYVRGDDLWFVHVADNNNGYSIYNNFYYNKVEDCCVISNYGYVVSETHSTYVNQTKGEYILNANAERRGTVLVTGDGGDRDLVTGYSKVTYTQKYHDIELEVATKADKAYAPGIYYHNNTIDNVLYNICDGCTIVNHNEIFGYEQDKNGNIRAVKIDRSVKKPGERESYSTTEGILISQSALGTTACLIFRSQQPVCGADILTMRSITLGGNLTCPYDFNGMKLKDYFSSYSNEASVKLRMEIYYCGRLFRTVYLRPYGIYDGGGDFSDKIYFYDRGNDDHSKSAYNDHNLLDEFCRIEMDCKGQFSITKDMEGYLEFKVYFSGFSGVISGDILRVFPGILWTSPSIEYYKSPKPSDLNLDKDMDLTRKDVVNTGCAGDELDVDYIHFDKSVYGLKVGSQPAKKPFGNKDTYNWGPMRETIKIDDVTDHEVDNVTNKNVNFMYNAVAQYYLDKTLYQTIAVGYEPKKDSGMIKIISVN